jgi:hypothetical protein
MIPVKYDKVLYSKKASFRVKLVKL